MYVCMYVCVCVCVYIYIYNKINRIVKLQDPSMYVFQFHILPTFSCQFWLQYLRPTTSPTPSNRHQKNPVAWAMEWNTQLSCHSITTKYHCRIEWNHRLILELLISLNHIILPLHFVASGTTVLCMKKITDNNFVRTGNIKNKSYITLIK